MLELGGLAERVDQRLAVLEARPCGVARPPRTARTLASGPCGPGATFSIMGCLSREVRIWEVERETGFEPATFCLGSRHSAS